MLYTGTITDDELILTDPCLLTKKENVKDIFVLSSQHNCNKFCKSHWLKFEFDEITSLTMNECEIDTDKKNTESEEFVSKAERAVKRMYVKSSYMYIQRIIT